MTSTCWHRRGSKGNYDEMSYRSSKYILCYSSFRSCFNLVNYMVDIENQRQGQLEEVPSSYLNTAKSINSKRHIINNNASLDSRCITTDRKTANWDKNKMKSEIMKNKVINVQNRNLKIIKIPTVDNRTASKESKRRKKKQTHQSLSLAQPLVTKSLFYKQKG